MQAEALWHGVDITSPLGNGYFWVPAEGLPHSPSRPRKEISLLGKNTEKVDAGDIQGSLGDTDPGSQNILNVKGACAKMSDKIGESESCNHILAAPWVSREQHYYTTTPVSTE